MRETRKIFPIFHSAPCNNNYLILAFHTSFTNTYICKLSVSINPKLNLNFLVGSSLYRHGGVHKTTLPV